MQGLDVAAPSAECLSRVPGHLQDPIRLPLHARCHRHALETVDGAAGPDSTAAAAVRIAGNSEEHGSLSQNLIL
eukprot:4132740-Pyramimonas_sp.AAC.1